MCSVPRSIEIREVVEEAGNKQADEHEETGNFFTNFVWKSNKLMHNLAVALFFTLQ